MHMQNLQNIKCQSTNDRWLYAFMFIKMIGLTFYTMPFYIPEIIDEDTNTL